MDLALSAALGSLVFLEKSRGGVKPAFLEFRVERGGGFPKDVVSNWPSPRYSSLIELGLTGSRLFCGFKPLV